jgi:hypothetical protein
MANTLITPAAVARMALDTLYERTIAAQLVYRDYEPDFAQGVGDTVTVRKPAVFTANEFNGTAIVTQDIVESSVPVTLDSFFDVSVSVGARELTLSLDEFDRRVVRPAMAAIAQGVDKKILAVLTAAAVTQSVGVQGTTPTDPKILRDATKILDDNSVPDADRYTILTSAAAAEVNKNELFLHADKAGSTDGLRRASLGDVFGTEVFKSTNFPSAAPAAGDSVVFHRTAAALVTRQVELPIDATPESAEILDYEGFALRVTRGYDMRAKANLMSIDLLCGVKLLDPSRIVRIAG